MKHKKRFLTPDYAFDGYKSVSPEFLLSAGLRFIIADIDNTLAPYEQPLPDGDNLAWFASMDENGIKIALVSNNRSERVELFNRDAGLTAFADCRKPSPGFVKKAMAAIGAYPGATVYIGDQIFTDTLAARLAGIASIKLPPIRDKKTLLFRIKRFLEIPVMKKYYRLEKKAGRSGTNGK